MQNKSLEECNCPCHEGVKLKHFKPCCTRCPKCGKNILDYAYNEHIQKCGGLPKDVENLLKKPHTE